MPRKPDTPEQAALKLSLSFQQEKKWFEEALDAERGIALEFRSVGEAMNRAQRLNKCRTFTRQEALIHKWLQGIYDNILVRREGMTIILEKSEPVKKMLLQAKNVEIAPTIKKELTEDEFLAKIQNHERMQNKPVSFEDVTYITIEGCGGDDVKVFMMIDSLKRQGKLWDKEDKLTTKNPSTE